MAAIATNAGPSLTPGTGYSASSSSTTYGHAEYSTSGVTSPTSFGATFSSSTVWAEAGIALEPLSTTTTSLVCTSSDIDVSSSTGCTATVSGASGSVSGETITFSQTSGTGTVSLSSSTCTLSGTSCSITVTGSTTGTATLQASYPGDTGNLPSSGTSSSLTINSALVAPVISVAPTTINSGSSATLSTTTAFSGGTSTYSCQWLDEPPAGSYANLGSSFACTTLSTPSTSTGSLSTSGTWNFELQVTDSGGAVKTSTAVTVTVSGGSSGPPPSLEEGNVTIYASSHSAGFLLITVTAQISQMQSAPFYEAVLPQYGYLANGTWGYLGYYQGTFGAVSGGQQGLTVTIAVTYNGLTLTGTLTCPAAGKMSSTSFVFGSP